MSQSSEPQPDGPERAALPVVVPRWVQLVMLPLAVLALWATARAAGQVLLIFLIAAVIALILNPLIGLVQRARLRRGLAVFAVYIGFFLVLVGIGVLLAQPVADQVRTFQRDVPGLVRKANVSLADFQAWLNDNGIHVQLQHQGETALQTLQRNVLQGSSSLVSFTSDLLTRLVETTLALVLVVVLSIYMLLYGRQIGELVRRVMPPGDGTPGDDYPRRVLKAVSGYVRGQALFSLAMGASASLGLFILGEVGVFPPGKSYGLFFGIFYGLMELIPYVGPVLGAIPALVVALFGDPLSALWLAIFFVVLQQLEGHVVAPQVFGSALRINPLLVIFALLLGGQIYGIVGALIALPLAAVARETVGYLREHLVLEPWNTPDAAALAVAGVLPGRAPPRPACAECGAVPNPGDAFCRSCGGELGMPSEIGAPS